MSGILGLAYDTISVNHLPTFMDNTKDIKEKSFSMYLHANPTESYMVIPGYDTEYCGIIDSHKVVEKKYWGLDLAGMKQGSTDVPCAGYKAVIDSGTSLIAGPTHIIDPLIDGIQVAGDCSNLKKLPSLTFTIDKTDYVLAPTDYVL